MELRVIFHVDKATGKVEIDVLDEAGSGLPEAEHNLRHDEMAAEIGRVVQRYPRVMEVTDTEPLRPDDVIVVQDDDEQTETSTTTEK